MSRLSSRIPLKDKHPYVGHDWERGCSQENDNLSTANLDATACVVRHRRVKRFYNVGRTVVAIPDVCQWQRQGCSLYLQTQGFIAKCVCTSQLSGLSSISSFYYSGTYTEMGWRVEAATIKVTNTITKLRGTPAVQLPLKRSSAARAPAHRNAAAAHASFRRHATVTNACSIASPASSSLTLAHSLVHSASENIRRRWTVTRQM